MRAAKGMNGASSAGVSIFTIEAAETCGSSAPITCAVYRAESIDQPYSCGIAPDQHRAARHQIHLDPLTPHNAIIFGGGLFHHLFEGIEINLRVGERVGESKDRVPFGLTVDAVEVQHARRG